MGKFFKVAGVGWDLRAYDLDPKQYDAGLKKYQKLEDAYFAAEEKAVGKFPGPGKGRVLGSRITGKPISQKTIENRPKVKAYRKRQVEFSKKNPSPLSSFEWEGDHEIRTKHPTNYKLNAHMDGNTPSEAKIEDQFVSDRVYGPNKIKNLSKADLQKIQKIYLNKAKIYRTQYKNNPKELAAIDKGVKAFMDKSNYILKDPKAKTIRLEME